MITCAININTPQIINAVPADVSLLEAEIPAELLFCLNNFPLTIRPNDTMITTIFITIDKINSGKTLVPILIYLRF